MTAAATFTDVLFFASCLAAAVGWVALVVLVAWHVEPGDPDVPGVPYQARHYRTVIGDAEEVEVELVDAGEAWETPRVRLHPVTVPLDEYQGPNDFALFREAFSGASVTTTYPAVHPIRFPAPRPFDWADHPGL